MDHEATPCQNLKKNASSMKIMVELTNGIVPNPIIAIPMKDKPNMSIFLRPKVVIIFPIIGDPIITATEYIQNMYPIVETPISHFLSSRGRNGTTREYQLFDRMFDTISQATSHLTMIQSLNL